MSMELSASDESDEGGEKKDKKKEAKNESGEVSGNSDQLLNFDESGS